MKEHIQSVRGMRDILPEEASTREILFVQTAAVLKSFGYQPIELPILERTPLFKRAVGEETDIVSKEMYTFLDRNEESLTLRPEATAGVVRAMIEQGLLQNVQRLYTAGAMFRYEKPQQGRYRQFTQISVETFGLPAPAVDGELMQIGHNIFTALGIRDHLTLEINTLGVMDERLTFQKDLIAYLNQHKDALDADSIRRLETNPLRILDSKDEGVKNCLKNAPVLWDYLGEESRAHFAHMQEMLDAMGIAYQVNPYLVRGLDYYCHAVFEWTTTALGAQGTVCAGGRYDGLVEKLGGKATPAAGFAFGMERILQLKEQIAPYTQKNPDIYVLAGSLKEQAYAMRFTQVLRTAFPSLTIVAHNDFQALKRQFKKADQAKAHFALVFGEQELATQTAMLKDLTTGTQQALSLEALTDYLKKEIL